MTVCTALLATTPTWTNLHAYAADTWADMGPHQEEAGSWHFVGALTEDSQILELGAKLIEKEVARNSTGAQREAWRAVRQQRQQRCYGEWPLQ